MADRTQWNADAHRDLLMAVMNNITSIAAEWDTKVAPELRAKGYKYTYKAAVYAFASFLPFPCSLVTIPTSTLCLLVNYRSRDVTLTRSCYHLPVVTQALSPNLHLPDLGSTTTQTSQPSSVHQKVASYSLSNIFHLIYLHHYHHQFIMDTPGKKGFKWTAEAERDLYAACLIAVGEPKGPTLSKAVQFLKENLDIDITVKAASHRV